MKVVWDRIQTSEDNQSLHRLAKIGLSQVVVSSKRPWVWYQKGNNSLGTKVLSHWIHLTDCKHNTGVLSCRKRKDQTGSYSKGGFTLSCEEHHRDWELCQTRNLVLIISSPPNSLNWQNRGENNITDTHSEQDRDRRKALLPTWEEQTLTWQYSCAGSNNI